MENNRCLKFLGVWMVSKNICTRKLQILNIVDTKIFWFTVLETLTFFCSAWKWLMHDFFWQHNVQNKILKGDCGLNIWTRILLKLECIVHFYILEILWANTQTRMNNPPLHWSNCKLKIAYLVIRIVAFPYPWKKWWQGPDSKILKCYYYLRQKSLPIVGHTKVSLHTDCSLI